MKVRAIRLGYYAYGDDPINHQRRYPAEYSHKPSAGEPFELQKPEHFSPNWMEIVEATEEERAIAEKRKPFDGAVRVTDFKYAPAPGVKVKLPLHEELAQKHQKRARKIKETKDEDEVL